MLQFKGKIHDIKYKPTFQEYALKTYVLDNFNINTSRPAGILRMDDIQIGYAKWVLPKRTRSYPLARVYSIYHLPKRVAIIPIMKDEGARGDLDRINYITLSWMNLANVYIILAYYQSAEPHPRESDKITKQQFDSDYIRSKLYELRDYQQTALHWNLSHFTNDFASLFQRAIDAYQVISETLHVKVHHSNEHEATLQAYLTDSRFNLDLFREQSLLGSHSAALRETVIQHPQELLEQGAKGYFYITNLLGGEYHLTADEILQLGDTVIIQESKHTKKDKLPKTPDIQDGLFKLILYANLNELYLNEQKVPFQVRLKLTGQLQGQLNLPSASSIDIARFSQDNQLNIVEKKRIMALKQESESNLNLSIAIGSSHDIS